VDDGVGKLEDKSSLEGLTTGLQLKRRKRLFASIVFGQYMALMTWGGGKHCELVLEI
jgi:hypothetical protein